MSALGEVGVATSVDAGQWARAILEDAGTVAACEF
jgi:hypothetical protein